MKKLDIKYEILNYDSYNKRLESLLNNPQKNPISKHMPIGYSSCGFSIDHYSIGNGPLHIVYLGGAHGNEIIGIDFVTQLMKNLAEGNGIFENFDPDTFTIDFIPCQNPEGFYTTTYALHQFLKNKTEEEIEKFSKEYHQAYKEDDNNVLAIDYILREFCKQFDLEAITDDLRLTFWQYFNNKEININSIVALLSSFFNYKEEDIRVFVVDKWNEKLNGKEIIPAFRYHQKMFETVTLDCIPPKDKAHTLLKEKLSKIYSAGRFPIGTLANFYANADGVNLNDNNEYFFEEMKEKRKFGNQVYANLRDNNLSKNYPGPVGTPNNHYNSRFEYTTENQALIDFLARQKEKDENFALINCHGTGGALYLYPVYDEDIETVKQNGTTRDFSFFINNRIATEYTKEIGRIYEQETGTYLPYETMEHPDRITGVGDLLRKQYIGSFLLELSNIVGNPIAPYADKDGNFRLTMEANMHAMMKMLETILSMEHLYNTTYTMSYQNGKVKYDTKVKKLK